MNLLALTHPDRVFINPPQRTPEALIRWLTEPLASRISSTIERHLSKAFYNAKVKVLPRWVKHSPSRTVKPRRFYRQHFVWRSLTIRYAGRGWKVMKR